MTLTKSQIIASLGLEAHPEGGYYRETYRAPVLPFELPQRGSRASSTAIYYLLAPFEFSAFHVVASDEVWHYYLGSPLELVTLNDTGEARVVRLGPDLANGERPQHVVPAGVLQAARPLGPDPTLCGCTVAPGFDFADFEMPSREALLARFPAARELVLALTRV